MKKYVLGRISPRFGLSVLVGVKPGNTKHDGTRVFGTWDENSRRSIGLSPRPLCERFVNWRSKPEEIVRFTETYGPLHERPKSDAAGKGVQFSFTIDSWLETQKAFRKDWNLQSSSLIGLPTEMTGLLRQPRTGNPVSDGGTFQTIRSDEVLHFEPGIVTCRVNTIWRFIDLQLNTFPRACLRVCRFCHTCFIESDRRTQYCGRQTCRILGKNESNKLGWHRNKAKWAKKA